MAKQKNNRPLLSKAYYQYSDQPSPASAAELRPGDRDSDLAADGRVQILRLNGRVIAQIERTLYHSRTSVLWLQRGILTDVLARDVRAEGLRTEVRLYTELAVAGARVPVFGL